MQIIRVFLQFLTLILQFLGAFQKKFILDIKCRLFYNFDMVVDLLIANEGYTHKNWFYKDLYLNCSMFYYIISGTAYYQDKHGTILLKPGHLYIFPTRQTFTLYDDPNNQLYHTFLHAITLPAITTLHEICVEEQSFLYDSIKLLRKSIPLGNKKVIISVLDMILTSIFDNDSTITPIASQTKDYIDTHLHDKITMDLLSNKLAYSKGHLNRVFQWEYNMSPIAYYNSQRLELSIKYLLEDKSSKNISLLLNYASPAAYCKAFKAKYGLPPEKYVEPMLKKPHAKKGKNN